MNMLTKYSAVLGTCLAVSFSIMGCSQKGNDYTKTVPALVNPVTEQLKTDIVKKGDIERTGYKTGYIIPIKKVDMCFKFKGGYLSTFNVKAGDIVKKGQVLAELDTTDKRYAIQEEEIRLKQAQLSYDNAVQNGASDIQKQISQLNIDAEKLKLKQLQEDLKNSVLVENKRIRGKAVEIIFWFTLLFTMLNNCANISIDK